MSDIRSSEERTPGGRPTWRWLLVPLLLAAPFAVHAILRASTALPDEVVFGTGPAGGRYRPLSEALGKALAHEHGVQVRFVPTSGSVENLGLVQRGEVDFALYQQSTWEVLEEGEGRDVAFVASMYDEPVHVLARVDAGLENASDLAGQRVNLGAHGSGDISMASFVLEHLDIGEHELDARHLDYDGVRRGLEDGTLDAAIVTIGLTAPMFTGLFDDGAVTLLDLPDRDALLHRHVFLRAHDVPAGSLDARPRRIPDHVVATVATSAQLLTHADVPSRLVEAVTALIRDRTFLKRSGLRELFLGGLDYAASNPSFPVHRGARNVYEPHLRPLMDPELAESTENQRPQVVSMAIGLFLLVRWLRRRAERGREHRLDGYLHALLGIEARQLTLDDPDTRTGDVDRLQQLLDEVTQLRQDALGSFTAHQLHEDRAIECFLDMCHGLSNKINAKISRQRLDEGVDRLIAAAERLAREARTP